MALNRDHNSTRRPQRDQTRAKFWAVRESGVLRRGEEVGVFVCVVCFVCVVVVFSVCFLFCVFFCVGVGGRFSIGRAFFYCVGVFCVDGWWPELLPSSWVKQLVCHVCAIDEHALQAVSELDPEAMLVSVDGISREGSPIREIVFRKSMFLDDVYIVRMLDLGQFDLGQLVQIVDFRVLCCVVLWFCVVCRVVCGVWCCEVCCVRCVGGVCVFFKIFVGASKM